MMHAYNSIYLNRAARIVGTMLHNAVLRFDFDGEDFLFRFIQTDVAKQIETGNPMYIAGKSGQELMLEVVERSEGAESAQMYLKQAPVKSYERSDVYWVGWMLTQYQWYSGKSFHRILERVPYRQILRLYNPLHEADITKSYEIMDRCFDDWESRLKRMRMYCSLTQEKLAADSGVSVNTIRAYERGAKDIGKAQIDIVQRLSTALKCKIQDILDV